MSIFLVLTAGLCVSFLLAFVVFVILRHRNRSKEDLKRGLSMVTMRIHLPPMSEDVESKTRDGRDVVEENIAKATVLYNLLASTIEKKSFKTTYYGQQHLGFEIIAKDDSVDFYAVAPVDLVPIIRQAVNSAYKSAKVEETEEHNLFDPQIKPESVLGGEMVLKEHFAYPIATYVNSRQDIMKSILGALYSLQDKDGAGLQILLRPADSSWTKSAQAKAKELSKSDKDNLLKDLAVSFVKNPQEKKEEASAKKEMTGLDKNLIESIEKKITQVGFEVLIRLIVSTPNLTESRNIYNNILAGLALLDAPRSNGFRHVATKNTNEFVNAFNLRLFPVASRSNILNVEELATIFHLPDEANIPTSQIERQLSKQVDAPRNFLNEGLLLGHNLFRHNKRPIIVGDEDRMRHMYVVGQTGTGKSVLLENLILQDMEEGKGFAFVDPHGESAEKVISRIPKHRLDDVIYFNPGNLDYPMGLNIFESDNVDQQDILIQEAIAMLYKLYDPQHQGIMGPRYEYIFRNAAKLVMADPKGGTFIDIPKLFNDRQFVEKKLQHVTDRPLLDFWRKEIVDASRSSEFGDLKSWFVSKFSAFLSNAMMRNIIGQNKSSFDLRSIMDEKKIMIINLSLGLTGELNMKLLGMLFVAKFQMAAMSRADVPASQRPDFTLYIDEFQNFATDSFANILSAARKYRLALVVANQHTTQLSEEIRDSVYGNVGTAISFRINAEDAEHLIKQFYHPVFEVDDLTRLPVGNAVVRTLINGAPTSPFNTATLPPPAEFDQEALKKNEQYLFSRHNKTRKEVEKEIFERLEMDTPLQKPSFGPPPPFAGASPLPPPPDMEARLKAMKLGGMKPPPMSEPGNPLGKPPKPSHEPVDDKFFQQWLKRRQDLKQDLLEEQKRLRKELAHQEQQKEELVHKQKNLKKQLQERLKAKAVKDPATKDE